jgi:F0F1-type ATP synthase assembly protein I
VTRANGTGRDGAQDKPSPGLYDLLAMGIAWSLMVAGGLGIGLAIDAWLGSSPWGVLAGLAFGVLAAIGSAVRQLRKYL